MLDFTSMTFCGRLTADPQVHTTSNGNSICRFTVATSRKVSKDREETSFLRVMVAGPEAENCANYLSKGREVLVTDATFETDSYTDREGVRREGFTFVVGRKGHVTFGRGGAKKDNTTESVRNLVKNKLNKDSGI